MEPGFWIFGWREAGALLLALAIVADWSAQRYLRPSRPDSVRDPGRSVGASG